MMLAHEDENSIFFRGTGTSPYIYVATKGDENKYIGTAYKANDFSDLEALSREFNVDIVENNDPGGGNKVTLIDPDGIISISLGAYGVPESFLLNNKSRIIKKYIGPLTSDNISEIIKIIQ